MEKNRRLQEIIILLIFLQTAKVTGLAQSGLSLSSYRSHQSYRNFDAKPSYSPISINRLIYNDIESALKPIYPNSSNLNKIINRVFDLNNSNDEYIFELPGKFANKLIMHRDDFQNPIFPNLTQSYIKLAEISRRIDDFNNLSQIKKSSDGDPTRLQTTIQLNDHFLSEELNDGEIGVVMANVVTEANFIDYMNNLNRKGEKYMKELSASMNKIKKIDLRLSEKNVKHPNYKTIPKVKYAKLPDAVKWDAANEWRSLGLEGWEGEIMRPKYLKKSEALEQNPTVGSEVFDIDSNKGPKDVFEVRLPNQYSFLDSDEKNTIWDLPGKVSSKQPLFTELLQSTENDETLKNLTKLFLSVSKPNWPITAKRNEHNMNDIYIARANDPYGHSTKWEFKNSTELNNHSRGNRKKRGIQNLYSMIKCSTGCDPIVYKGYGCFCGFMGGGVPVDGIDRCCRMHDNCYGKTNCPSYLTYFIPYLWKCYNGEPICATSHGEWGGPNSCAAKLCKCDLKLSRCLRKFKCPNRRAVCRTSRIRLLQNYIMIL